MRIAGALKLTIVLISLCLSASFSYAEPVGKVLLVVAHPDDEYYFAATVYRLSVQLHTRVDELIITDGEAGFHYATLAEPYYKKPLTIEAVARKELPAIRKRETLNAGKVIGIDHHIFLEQKDQGFTTDADEGPKHTWNTALVIRKIKAQIKHYHYSYIFAILPRSTTHGHHQAATALAALAIQGLPETERPVLLGFDTDGSSFLFEKSVKNGEQWSPDFSYAFDRTTRLGFHNALSYQIVVDWMIAEHKSQGLFQTMCEKDPKEYMWIDWSSAPGAQAKTKALFEALNVVLEKPGTRQ